MTKDYCVYEHIDPNGKRYIGISSNPIARWNNGFGYKKQTKFYDAISRFGWEKFQHNIIVEGLSEYQARNIERYLISAFGTIENGYNTSTGGQSINGTYLDPYILDMIRSAKHYWPDSFPEVIHEGYKYQLSFIAYFHRFNPEVSSYFNCTADAVTRKHGKFSPTGELEVSRFWHHIRQFYELDEKIQNGEDVSQWKEKRWEEAVWEGTHGK